MQRERRHNPYPLTWEIPVGIACLMLLLLVLGAHGGRAAANLAAGGGLTFPPATELFPASIGLLRGDAAAGLDNPPTAVAAPGSLQAWIVASEVVVLALSAWAGRARLPAVGARPDAGHGHQSPSRRAARAQPAAQNPRRGATRPVRERRETVNGFDPRDVGWRLGRSHEPRGTTCGCPGTAPPASSDPRVRVRHWTCSPPHCSTRQERRW